jgi:glycerol-3-phosphate dehydrogenase
LAALPSAPEFLNHPDSLKRNLNEVADASFDIAVVGGGITGAGVARHATLAGLKTVVLEASDFAAGTSSRSTKLIHGGLRYLAMGDVALVRETALERKRLFEMAPHLTEPQWMVVPARSRLELVKFRIGISLYERLGAVARADRHVNWSQQDLGAEEPLLNLQAFPFACRYREYLTDDARLVMATLRGAALEGAQVCNRLQVTGLEQEADGVRLTCRDTLGDADLSLRAKVVVNATGPWVEQFAANSGGHSDNPRLHLSKGVHIGVPRDRLPVHNMVMMTADDRRPVFAIARGNVTYIGTTDTTEEGEPSLWPAVKSADVDYLLQPIRRYFPQAKIDQSDIVSTWAGLRPLINQPGKAPKEMSRKEEVWRSGRLVTIAGGKLTGFRKMAEQVMVEVAQILNKPVDAEQPLLTLPGGEQSDLGGLMRQIAARYPVDAQASRRLMRLYGSEVFAVLGDNPTPITQAVFAEEIDWAVTQECALSLEDVVYRRLRIPWFRPEETEPVAVAAADLLATQFNWSAQHRECELSALRSRVRSDLSFRLDG